MTRAPVPRSRPPRLLPTPYQLGAEPDAFALSTQDDQEGLASLVYTAGASTGSGDSNTATSSFIATMNNSVFSQYMNNALGL
jgi:hypothetical protein